MGPFTYYVIIFLFICDPPPPLTKNIECSVAAGISQLHTILYFIHHFFNLTRHKKVRLETSLQISFFSFAYVIIKHKNKHFQESLPH